MTIEEIKNLNKKLEELKNVEIKNILKEISDARLLGDLSENPEYHFAKKKKIFLDLKIKELENILSNCEVVKEKKISQFLKIKLKNIKTGKIKLYNNLSPDSPLIKLIENKKAKDIIKVVKYNKEFLFEIIEIN